MGEGHDDFNPNDFSITKKEDWVQEYLRKERQEGRTGRKKERGGGKEEKRTEKRKRKKKRRRNKEERKRKQTSKQELVPLVCFQ